MQRAPKNTTTLNVCYGAEAKEEGGGGGEHLCVLCEGDVCVCMCVCVWVCVRAFSE